MSSGLAWPGLGFPSPPLRLTGSPSLGKTALLHALASSDGVQVHNAENIRLLLEGGEPHPSTRPPDREARPPRPRPPPTFSSPSWLS